MRAFRKTATVLCGLVFLFSAVAKLLSVRSFELYVFSLGLLSFDFTSLAARLLILLEGCTGLWFLSGWKLRWAKWIAWAQLAFFSAFLFWRIFLADGASCHCFGELIDLNPWQSLGKNVLLALLIALSAEELWPRPLRPLYLAAVGLAAGIGLFVASPPDWYYRQGRETGYVVPDKWEALEKEHPLPGKRIVCFLSTRCEHCQDLSRKLYGMLERQGIGPEYMQTFFLMTSDSTQVEVEAFFKDFFGGTVYPSAVLDPLTFLGVTSGAMPVVVLSEDGRPVQEFDYYALDEKAMAAFLFQ